MDWHQDGRAVPLIRQYQLTLDTILRSRADLASCAVCCCHCGIRFLTHPRNAGRQDLRCPFGCRAHHRRRQAVARSKKHYQTDQGRRSKKRLNGKRSASSNHCSVPLQATVCEAAPVVDHASSIDSSSTCQTLAPHEPDPRHQSMARLAVEGAPEDELRLTLDGFTLGRASLLNSPMLSYLAMVATVIEGRLIGCQELIQALCTSMRQRSFDRLPKREYVLCFLNQHPP